MSPELADLVLDALDVPEKAPAPKKLHPLEVLRNDDYQYLEADELFPYIEKAEADARTGTNIWENAALLAALCEKAMVAEPEDGLVAFIIEAREAEKGNRAALNRHIERIQKIREAIEEDIYFEAKESLLWGWAGFIEFLQGIWRDDLREALVEATGAKPATATRWINGQEGNYTNLRRLRAFASVTYDLQHKLGWSDNQVRTWASTPIGKSTPLELFRRGTYYRYHKELFAELRRLEIR